MKTTRLFLGLALLATTLMASDCPFLTPFGIVLSDVVLSNETNQPIHILTEGESFAPGNQLQPGGTRKVAERLINGEAITFRAGRNGLVLDRVQCTPTDNTPFGPPNIDSLRPVVIWKPSGLVCAGWTL